MAHKQILFHSAAREKILRGTAALADAVRVTLGPKSKSVLIQKKWGAPIVCNDGVKWCGGNPRRRTRAMMPRKTNMSIWSRPASSILRR